jgi:competence protein ComFC
MRRAISAVGSVLTDLFFPPRCAACGELLPPFGRLKSDESPMLCQHCLPLWEKARAQAPDRFPERIVWLVPYCPEEPSATVQQVIFRLKHRDDRRLADWLSAQLADPVRVALASVGADAKEAVCLYPPRRCAAVRRDGFDQARRLACGLADCLGAVCLPAVRRVSDGAGEQKKLHAAERRANAEAAYVLDGRLSARLSGRWVVLVDDLFTTGATLSRLSDLARSARASGVLCATVARTRERARS